MNLLDHDKIKAITNKVANKNSVRPEILRDLLEEFFIDFKDQLSSDELPTVLIRNLGRFRPTVGRLSKQIIYKREKLKVEIEEEKREKLIEEIDRYERIKLRIIEEIHLRNAK